jgi:hypothetical protein
MVPFTADEFARLINGHLPQGAHDDWFMFWEPPWLYIHQSTNGYCVFQVRVVPEGEHFRVAEIMVNRNRSQYPEVSDERDALLVSVLLANLAVRDADGLLDQIAARERSSEAARSFARGSLMPARVGCLLVAVVVIAVPVAIVTWSPLLSLLLFAMLYWIVYLGLGAAILVLLINWARKRSNK